MSERVSFTKLDALARLGLFGITRETEEHLALIRGALSLGRAQIAEAFAAHLFSFPAFRAVFTSPVQLEELAHTLDDELYRLGDFHLSDSRSVLAYVERQLRLGEHYQQIGLSPKLYLGAHAKLAASAAAALGAAYPGRTDLLSSLHKMLLFDCHLALEAYEHVRESLIVATANRDGLTGLANRTTTIAALEAEFDRTARFHRPFSILFIDIDHFKAINDQGGHAEGDAVLRAVATVLAQCVRPEDILGRFGGDEFVTGLIETDLDAAVAVARRMQARLAPVRSLMSPVTISIGAATRRHEDNLARLIARADRALYEAKAAGRDRVAFT